MICPPCADAADIAVAEKRLFTDIGHPLAAVLDGDHDPALCRDAAIQPAGCACQHLPAGTSKGTPRA